MERRTSLDTSLGGDAVRLTTSKCITLCITMLTGMLLARFRTFEEYGTYSQLLLVINLFASIFMLGLPNSINYFLSRAETPEERQRFLSVYYTLSTLLSIVMGVVLVLAVPLIEAYFQNPAIRGFCYFLALYPWSSTISSSVENVLVVYQRTRFLMGYRFVNSICLLGTVVLIEWLGWGFGAYMRLYLAVCIVFALSVYLLTARLCGGLRFSVDRGLIRAIFAFSLPMGLAAVVGTLSIEIDKLLIGRMMDTAQLAIYTNAAKELPVTVVAASITAVLLPRLTRMLKDGDDRGAARLWGTSVELSFMVICLIVAGVFTYAEDVLTFLYSEKYLPGLSVFRVYTLVLLLRCTYFGMILNAKGKTRQIFYCSVATLLLNALLNFLLFQWMGMIGPAIATFLSMLLPAVVQLYMSAYHTGAPFGEIFPWKRLGRILLLNILLACCFAEIKQILPLEYYVGSFLESILLGCIWSALYAAVLWQRAREVWRQLNGTGE